jgi:hypothetical protein
MRFIGFCLSLLPVPVIQQAGQAIDRHYSDKSFQSELQKTWDQLISLNSEINRIDELEKAIQEIARTVKEHPTLTKSVQDLLNQLPNGSTSFRVITEDNSFQEILDCLISADITVVQAKGNSINQITGTTVNSPSTLLHASGNSENRVRSTSFISPKGSTSMDNLSTQGPIKIEGSSIGIGAGGVIGFGPQGMLGFSPPKNAQSTVVSGNLSASCKNCHVLLRFKRSELIGKSIITCPICHSSFPFRILDT